MICMSAAIEKARWEDFGGQLKGNISNQNLTREADGSFHLPPTGKIPFSINFPFWPYQPHLVTPNTAVTGMTTITAGPITANFISEQLCPKVEA